MERTELCADQDCWKPLNLQSLKVINLLDTTVAGCAQNIKDNNSLVAITLDPISSEPILIHHLTQIGCSLSQDTTYLVALFGFGLHASTVHLPPVVTFFECVVDHEVPDPKCMLADAESKSLLSLLGNAQEVGSYRGIILLPPFLEEAIMLAPSLLLSDLTIIVLATSANMKPELEDAEEFNVQEHDLAAVRVLSFL